MRFRANTKRTTQTIERSLYVNLKHQEDILKTKNFYDRITAKAVPARWFLGTLNVIYFTYFRLQKFAFQGCRFSGDIATCTCTIRLPNWMDSEQPPFQKYYSALCRAKPSPREVYRLVFDSSKWTLEAFRL
jgi:hypothetical protein